VPPLLDLLGEGRAQLAQVVTALEPSVLSVVPARRWWSAAGTLLWALRRRRVLPAVQKL
jgi:hypothetical protein